ncbi:MAG TPA: four-carbon acid sugar kinase family protein [Ilumatobacteraceae bacterium]|nr:four-carbon acid sugar kinase family protein [Ilumatobacteraceae bacterium]
MSSWQVVADDRTGAYEVAGLLAGADGVVVAVGDRACEGVIDLGTRGLPPGDAAAVARRLPATDWMGHKIDSTLRGNWAHEVRARRLETGRRVVVLPGWPDMGRTCVAGVVRMFDEPVGAMKDHLPEAALVPHVAALRHWWDTGRAVAVCDVPDTEAMLEIAAAVAQLPEDELIVAGPAGPLAAVWWARAGGRPAAPAAPAVESPALVVCGSANSMAHRQLAQLRMARPHVEVLAVQSAATGVELEPGPARELAKQARARLDAGDIATLVLAGGDTAAAVLGDAPRRVGGMIAPGMPWSRDADGGGPLVITKAGGFGGVDALARLFPGKTE